jgi:hypothetical protein
LLECDVYTAYSRKQAANCQFHEQLIDMIEAGIPII